MSIDLPSFARSCFEPIPKQSVTDWCLDNLILPPPHANPSGPFSITGREFLREVIDDFGDYTIKDCVDCFGSQSGKTTALMAGLAWVVVNDPSGVLWVMPNADLARSFSETRWTPLIYATPMLERLVPLGKRRHDFKKSQQQIGGALLNFIGSNSPANLASRPVRRLILDEVDKFDEGGRGEADAVNLAEQRTKSFGNAQRRKTSTPTVHEGLIWQEFLKGDQRRYFVPCPHCGKFVVLVWSKAFTVFKLTGAEAFIEWDKEAKRPDGEWDLERVLKSARAVCPHCAGHILDSQKTRMLRQGEWRATTQAPIAFRSRHLPSLYAASPQTSFGAMAVKFLQAKKSLQGLQGFINGDLAEPYMSQDTRTQRIDLITARIEVTAQWKKQLTVDCQARAPYFWHVVRYWSENQTQAVEAGSLDTWDDIRAVQKKHAIDDVAVLVDSGWGARSESDVYGTCARFSEMLPRQGMPPLAMGWLPSKGMPGNKRWKDSQSNLLVPWFLASIDPYAGRSHEGQIEMSLLEFSGDFFEDILEALRSGKGKARWSVTAEVGTEEYWRQLDAKTKMATFNRKTGKTAHQWTKRDKHWPEHLRDCEVLQIVGASFFGWFNPE